MTYDTQAIARLQAAIATIARDPAAGAREAEAIVRASPALPPAWRVLALARRKLGQEPEAQQLELKGIAAALQLPALEQAQAAMAEERLDDAEPLVRAHLRQDPEDPAGALMLGEIALRSGARREAENLFRRAFLLAPAYVEARLALAKSQREAGSYPAALQTLADLLRHDPAHLPALSLKAAIMVQLRHFAEAEATFLQLLDRHPRDARGAMNYAFMLKTVGRQQDAVAAYRRSLAIDPGHAQAWWGLANLKTVKFSGEDIDAMRHALDHMPANREEDDRIHLLYALGKALDDQGRYAEAFAVYDEGARARLARTPHDAERVMDNVRKVERTFTPAFFDTRKNWGCKTPDPIFIVSLPRSGSTLVEQILASHPMIEGTEELHDIERIAMDLAPGEPTGSYCDKLEGLSEARVLALGQHYIQATRRVRQTRRPFFTDKMPSNWVFSGFIELILPNAKIIDVRRHPLGCGFANFSQHFNWGINFSYDLAHIGNFYSAYVRQMAHFDRVLPGRIHHVTYEGLVHDLEGEVRRMLAYLGLPFDEACLRFFETERAVYTPSSEQVRRPIDREGTERWQRYEEWLGPLKQALGPVLDHYPEAPPSFD